MDPQIPEVEEVPSLLLPCASCSRTFRPEALAKHSKVCEKTLMKKRKQFDSAKQRLQGTEIESFVTQPIIKNPRKKEPQLNPSKAKIKEKIDLAKTIQVAKKSLESPPCVAQVKPSDHEECPHCGRSFGPKAFERHTEFCKEQHQKLKLTPTFNNEAKERLKVRTSYRGPLTNKVLNRDRYQPSRNRDPSPMGSSLTELRDEGGKSKGLMRNASLRSSLRSRPTESVAPPPLRRTMTQINPPRSVRGSRDSINEPDEKLLENNGKNRSTTCRPRLYSRESTDRKKKSSDFPSAQSSSNKKFSSAGKAHLDLNDTSVNTFKELNVTSAKIEKMPLKQPSNKFETKGRSKLPIFQRNKVNNSPNISSSKVEPVISSAGNIGERPPSSFSDFSENISSHLNNGKLNTVEREEHPVIEESLHQSASNSFTSLYDNLYVIEVEKPADSSHRDSNSNELVRNDSDCSVLSLTQSFGQTYDSPEAKRSIPDVGFEDRSKQDNDCTGELSPGQLFDRKLSTVEFQRNRLLSECNSYVEESYVTNFKVLSCHGDSLQVLSSDSAPENTNTLSNDLTVEVQSVAELKLDSSIEADRHYTFDENPINKPSCENPIQLFDAANCTSQACSTGTCEEFSKNTDLPYSKLHCQETSEKNLNYNIYSSFKENLNNSCQLESTSSISDCGDSPKVAVESFSRNSLIYNPDICSYKTYSSIVNEKGNKMLNHNTLSDLKEARNTQIESQINIDICEDPKTDKSCNINTFPSPLEDDCLKNNEKPCSSSVSENPGKDNAKFCETADQEKYAIQSFCSSNAQKIVKNNYTDHETNIEIKNYKNLRTEISREDGCLENLEKQNSVSCSKSIGLDETENPKFYGNNTANKKYSEMMCVNVGSNQKTLNNHDATYYESKINIDNCKNLKRELSSIINSFPSTLGNGCLENNEKESSISFSENNAVSEEIKNTKFGDFSVADEEYNEMLCVGHDIEHKTLKNENKFNIDNCKNPATECCTKALSFLSIRDNGCMENIAIQSSVLENIVVYEKDNGKICDVRTIDTLSSYDKNKYTLITVREIEATVPNDNSSDEINMSGRVVNTILPVEVEPKTFQKYYKHLDPNSFMNISSSCETIAATPGESQALPAGLESVVPSNGILHSSHCFDADRENPSDKNKLSLEHSGSRNPSTDNIIEKCDHKDQTILKNLCPMDELKNLDLISGSIKSVEDPVTFGSVLTCISKSQTHTEEMVIDNEIVVNSRKNIMLSHPSLKSEENSDGVHIPAFEFTEEHPLVKQSSHSLNGPCSPLDASLKPCPLTKLPLKKSGNLSTETSSTNSVAESVIASKEIGMKSSLVSNFHRTFSSIIEEESLLQNMGYAGPDKAHQPNISEIVEAVNEPLVTSKESDFPLVPSIISKGQTSVLTRNTQNETPLISFPLLEIETPITGDCVTMSQNGNDELTDIFSHSDDIPNSFLYQSPSLNYLNLIIRSGSICKNNLCQEFIYQNRISLKIDSTKLERAHALCANELKIACQPPVIELKDRPKTAPAAFNYFNSITVVRKLIHDGNNCTRNNADPYLTQTKNDSLFLGASEELNVIIDQSKLKLNKTNNFKTQPVFRKPCHEAMNVRKNSFYQEGFVYEDHNLIPTSSESNSQVLTTLKPEEENLGSVFEPDGDTNRGRDTVPYFCESTILSKEFVPSNSDIAWFVGYGNLDTLNEISHHEKLEETNISASSIISNQNFVDFNSRELSEEPMNGVSSAPLNSCGFLEDKTVYETCDDNRLDSQNIYSTGDQIELDSDKNIFMNNDFLDTNVLENSQADKNFGTEVFIDMREKYENNCITWQDIAESYSSSQNDSYGALDTITEDSLEAYNCERKDPKCTKKCCFPESNQILFWNDRQPYINIDSDELNNNNSDKERGKSSRKDMKYRRRISDRFHPEDFPTSFEGGIARDSLESLSGNSALGSRPFKRHSGFNSNPLNRTENHRRPQGFSLPRSQQNYFNNNKNKYFCTPHEGNKTQEVCPKHLPPVIVYKKVSKQIKKIYEHANDQYYPNEYFKKKIFNKSMKDGNLIEKRFRDKETNFDSDWEFSDSSDDTEKENSNIFCKESYESLEYNENQEGNDCHTVKTSIHEIPFSYKKMEPSIKLPPLQSPNVSFQTLESKTPLLRRKSSKIEKLPPLGTSSGAGDTPKASPRNNATTFEKNQRNLNNSIDSAYSSLTRSSGAEGSGKSSELPKFCHECGSKYPVAMAKFCCNCGMRRIAL